MGKEGHDDPRKRREQVGPRQSGENREQNITLTEGGKVVAQKV